MYFTNPCISTIYRRKTRCACDVEFSDFGTRLRPDSQMSFCFKDKVLHIHLIRRNPGFLHCQKFSKIKTHAYKKKFEYTRIKYQIVSNVVGTLQAYIKKNCKKCIKGNEYQNRAGVRFKGY